MATSTASGGVDETRRAVLPKEEEVEDSTCCISRPVVTVPIDEDLPHLPRYKRSTLTLDMEEFEDDETRSTTVSTSSSGIKKADSMELREVKDEKVDKKKLMIKSAFTLDMIKSRNYEPERLSPSQPGSEFGDEIPNKRNVVTKSMKPEIYRAASQGDIQFFEQLASDDPEFPISDQVSPRGRTVLHIVAADSIGSSHAAELVSLILQRCPDLLTTKDHAGNTALHVAARAGNVDATNELIRFAKEHHNWFVYSQLQNRKGNMALHLALENLRGVGSVDVARLLVEECLNCRNEDEESPLYLAAMAGNLEIVKLLVEKPLIDNEDETVGKPVVQAAIRSKNTEILDAILTKMPTLIEPFDEEERTPLSFAAQAGDLNTVLYILDKFADCAYKSDNNANGFFPIHAAASGGHKEIVGEFLRRFPDTWELLTHKGQQNILHVAARRGKARMVKYLLEISDETWRSKLVNEGDKNGDTPLHLATKHWHPKVVSILTWKKSVRLDLVNIDGFTALEVARRSLHEVTSFRQRLTIAALKSARVKSDRNKHTPETDSLLTRNQRPPSCEPYKERVNTLLLVATLIATVTFACGFTIPGGNNDNSGTATLLSKGMFQAFLICNTIATYSSIMAVVILIAAQLEDVNLMLTTVRLALPLIGVALSTMSFSFTAGVYLIVRDLRWLAIMVLVVGLVFACILVMLYLQLCVPLSSGNQVLRYLFYHSFCLMVWATGSDKDVAQY